MPKFEIEDRLVPQRSRSSYVSDQGNQNTCYAHATTRLITRLIKLRFFRHFKGKNEKFDDYYNTTNCGSVIKSIFQCILDAESKYNLDNSTQWETESISALLFHYIYTCIIEVFGCAGGNSAVSIDYILKLFKTEITVDDIKTKLNYKPRIFERQFTEEQLTIFNMLIMKLAAIFNDIRATLTFNLFTPKLFSSNNLGPFTLFKNEINDSQMPQAKLVRMNESIKSGYYFTDTLNTIKSVILKGFYVLLGVNEHAIIISDIDRTNDSLIIKNSWGDKITNWTIGHYTLIENNKINWTTLQAYLANPPKEDTSIIKIKLVFVIPIEMMVGKLASSKPTSSFKVRLFGMGRKPRNKKYTKKLKKLKKFKKPKAPRKAIHR